MVGTPKISKSDHLSQHEEHDNSYGRIRDYRRCFVLTIGRTRIYPTTDNCGGGTTINTNHPPPSPPPPLHNDNDCFLLTSPYGSLWMRSNHYHYSAVVWGGWRRLQHNNPPPQSIVIMIHPQLLLKSEPQGEVVGVWSNIIIIGGGGLFDLPR